MTTGLNYVLHPLTQATRPYLLLLYICKNGVWYLLSYEWYLPRQAVYIQVEVAYNLAGVCRCVSQVSFSVPHRYPKDGWWRPAQWPAWSCPRCRGHHQHLQTVRQSDSQTVRYQTFLKQTDMERKCQVFLRGAYACGELTVHLYQEFRLHSPASLMLTVWAPLAANGVYLVNENGAWCIVASLWVRGEGGRGRKGDEKGKG